MRFTAAAFEYTGIGVVSEGSARVHLACRVKESVRFRRCDRVIAPHPQQLVPSGAPSVARKPNYDFEKRRKEQDRKAKKDAKRTDRQQRREDRRTEEGTAEQTPEQ